jgi:hypothetical protein
VRPRTGMFGKLTPQSVNYTGSTGGRQRRRNGRCKMVNCHLSSVVALRAIFLKNAAPKAHPKNHK